MQPSLSHSVIRRGVGSVGGCNRIYEEDNDLIGDPEEPGLIGNDERFEDYQSSSTSGFRVHSPRHWRSLHHIDTNEGGYPSATTQRPLVKREAGSAVKREVESPKVKREPEPNVVWPS